MEVFADNWKEYITIVLTLIIATIGIVVNRDSEKKGFRKKINKGGWTLLLMVLISSLVSLSSTYQSHVEKQQELKVISAEKLEQEARYEIEKAYMSAQLRNSEVHQKALTIALQKLDKTNDQIAKSQEHLSTTKEHLISHVDRIGEEAKHTAISLNDRIYFSISLASHSPLDSIEVLRTLTNLFGENIIGEIFFGREDADTLTTAFLYQPIAKHKLNEIDLLTLKYRLKGNGGVGFYSRAEQLPDIGDELRFIQTIPSDRNRIPSLYYTYTITFPKLILSHKDNQLRRNFNFSDIYNSQMKVTLPAGSIASLTNCFVENNLRHIEFLVQFGLNNDYSNIFACQINDCNRFTLSSRKLTFISDKKINNESINENRIFKKRY